LGGRDRQGTEGYGSGSGSEMKKVQLGQVVATPGVLAALETSGDSLLHYLRLHEFGYWGDLDADDQQANEVALRDDLRILSAYTLSSGVRIWIITEADRSSTCVLLPEEY
jgi:hypothetical protein